MLADRATPVFYPLEADLAIFRGCLKVLSGSITQIRKQQRESQKRRYKYC
jgi:hypothetical protein